MKKFNSSKSDEISSNYHIYNPSRFEGPFRWTVTFKAPFDPLEIALTFQYQQITLHVAKRRMGTISTEICK